MTKIKANSDFPSPPPPWTASFNESRRIQIINYMLPNIYIFVIECTFKDF